MKILSLSLSLPLSLALLAPFAGGCVIVEGTTESGTESASSTSSASASDSDSNTETSNSTSSTGTAGSASDSDSSTTATSTPTTPTTITTSDETDGPGSDTDTDTGTDTDATTSMGTGGDEAIIASCEAACETVLDCQPDQFDTFEECVELCTSESTPLDPENTPCEMATIGLNECVAAAECGDFDEPDFCVAEFDAVELACDGGGDDCIGGVGGNEEGTECSLVEECIDEYDHELLCTPEGCSCYEDGELTEECMPQMNVCQDFDPQVLEDLAGECCGW